VTRAIVVDDHAVVRGGLRAVLERAGIEVVEEAATGAEALDVVARTPCDVAVVDLSLPDLPGDEVVRRIQQSGPAAVAHLLHDTPTWIRAALRAGARGLVTRSAPASEVVEAVRQAAQGRSFVSPSLTDVVLTLARIGAEDDDLGPSDRAILMGIAQGASNRDIGARLALAERTVEAARARLRVLLGASTTADLVRAAVVRGLVDAD